MGLIQVFDALTSGRRIRSITFMDGGVMNSRGEGMKVILVDAQENTDGWVCFSDEGIWLTYTADVTTREGYIGKRGQEEPLSSIASVMLV